MYWFIGYATLIANASDMATNKEASDKQMVVTKKLWLTIVPVSTFVATIVDGVAIQIVYRFFA